MTNTDTAPSVRLTRRSVEAAQKGAARYFIWDSDLKGFGLRVETSGTKTYVVRYRVGGGRRGTLRQFKIGRANKLTPDEARDQAKAALAAVETGKDPQAERNEARKVLTVAELCDLYMAEGVSTKKPGTVALDQIRVDRHIKPQIGGRKITELDAGDVERMMNAIAAGKVKTPEHPHTRGGKTAATKAVKLLRAIFNFAIARKLCAENPCLGVKTFPDGKRERFLSPAELGLLGDALTAAATEGAHPYHVAIFRLLALTGARKNEIARLRWSEVDLERGLLQLEDSKTGRKVIRLGAAALELVTAIDRTKSPYVFPDPRDPALPIRNLDWAWVGIRKRADLNGLRVHDLRHSFASVGVAGGSGLFLIGKLLGHSHVATTSRYAHLADDPVKAAADKIAREIDAMLGGEPGADVKPMGGAAS
jgi:integrase